MWVLISAIGLAALAAILIWARNKWVLSTFESYGAYGSMAGFYLYKKFGMWHIGSKQLDAIAEAESEEAAKKQRPHIKEAYANPVH